MTESIRVVAWGWGREGEETNYKEIGGKRKEEVMTLFLIEL